MAETDNCCTYCRRKLRKKYKFSIPIQGVRTLYACDRWWCKWLFQKGRRARKIREEQWEELARQNGGAGRTVVGGGAVRIRPIIAWYDLWVGIFIDRQKRRVYFLPLPCIGLVIEWSAPSQPKPMAWQEDQQGPYQRFGV